MGKLRVMMRLWQGYALKVSLATSENEFLYKNKSEVIPDIYIYIYIYTNYEKLKSNVISFGASQFVLE